MAAATSQRCSRVRAKNFRAMIDMKCQTLMRHLRAQVARVGWVAGRQVMQWAMRRATPWAICPMTKLATRPETGDSKHPELDRATRQTRGLRARARAETLVRVNAHQFAGGQQRDALAEQQGFAQIVGDECDGLSQARGQRAKFALQFGARDRIERAKRLVHQQDGRDRRRGRARRRRAGAGRRKARGRGGRRIRRRRGRRAGASRGRGRGCALGPAFEARHQRDVALDGPVREQADVLNDVTDAAAQADGVPLRLIAALDEDLRRRSARADGL